MNNILLSKEYYLGSKKALILVSMPLAIPIFY